MVSFMDVGPGWPPSPLSATELQSCGPLEENLKSLLREYKVNHSTWARLSAEGFHSLSDFSERFATKEHARTEGAAALGYRP